MKDYIYAAGVQEVEDGRKIPVYGMRAGPSPDLVQVQRDAIRGLSKEDEERVVLFRSETGPLEDYQVYRDGAWLTIKKSRPKRIRFVVELDFPEGATVGDVKAYVEDAIGSWCSALRPPGAHGELDDGDLLWGIGKTAKVTRA